MTTPPGSHPADDPDDLAALAAHARALVEAVEASLPAWAERVVAERWRGWASEQPSAELLEAARTAGEQARAEVVPALNELLATDVDAQRANPLAIIRRSVTPVTGVLREAGVPPLPRDADAVRLFPDDDYDVTPAAFADLSQDVHEPGLVWGAAKAHVILRRRRAEQR